MCSNTAVFNLPLPKECFNCSGTGNSTKSPSSPTGKLTLIVVEQEVKTSVSKDYSDK